MKPKSKKIPSVILCILAANLFTLNIPVVSAQEFPKIDSNRWTTKYDGYFRKYTKRFFGAGFDWKWFKAQAITESGLREDAKSWVNAKGLMQIMPRTFKEIKEKNPSFTDINEPRWNIAAGIYYDHQQYRRWKNLDYEHRMKFTFGSYNAGYSTIRKAQSLSKNEGFSGNTWDDIEVVAPRVSRWRHKETLGYVKKITNMMEK